MPRREREERLVGRMSRQERNSVRSDIMVEEGWVDTLKKEVIEYTENGDPRVIATIDMEDEYLLHDSPALKTPSPKKKTYRLKSFITPLLLPLLLLLLRLLLRLLW